MRGFFYVLTAMVVMSLAFWVYHENYETKRSLEQTQQLQRQIGQMRERLGILRAEWAYLNRPDRLRALTEINFDRLGLLPLRPEQFGRIDEVAFPAPPEIEIGFETETAEVSQ